ncbi:MAG: macro domain-containing protein [Saprospiraceae bacterium]|jgi:O-acetyl-ADP-ribose deacetylase (regulator of RNase III)|nr:macro domain-containing protein [Saprospiraceae bacterium]
MIKEVEGDILLSNADAIAHGVAPMDHFDTGFSLSLRENYPSMYKDFRHYCQTFHPKPGEVWFWQSADKRKIFNLLTQEPAPAASAHPGRATASAIRHCLKNMVKQIQKEGIKSLAITKLSTGVGGMEWSEVKPILEEHLNELGIPVYVYSVYHKNVAAEEGRL